MGETEFARDPTFGYRSSNLREFVAEKRGDVAITASRSRTSARGARPSGSTARDGQWVVVNAEDYDDLDAVVRGRAAVRRAFVYRTGPSFVRALAGIEPIAPLTATDIWPDGRPGGHGLVVVGSHVGLTTRQVEARRTGLHEIELDVSALDPATARARGWARAGRERRPRSTRAARSSAATTLAIARGSRAR